ncbi:MAG: adenosylmethionine--8-amino-7-oxononanoate transaminase [Planctomycetota bacterium]|nr:adenosylmethionine--8-amino-7-oxononanoate transaminase [Planctomycetota bacterium]
MTSTESLAARDAVHQWHPYTQHAIEREPLAVVRASGAELELADGRVLIDAISSWWTSLHGHGEPRLIDAMTQQAQRLDHVLFAGATHEPAVALGEELLAVTPPGLNRIFFSDNGSTAIEVALKMAFQRHVLEGHEARRVFVGLEGSYHGDTFGAMAVGDPDPFFAPFAPLLFEVRRTKPCASALESVLDELGPRAAGVLLEPLVQGAGGMRMHDADFLRAARRMTRARGLPLIADEVMTGFGRTGALFACGKAGIEPDLMCLAKGLTGGLLPMAATLATESYYEAFLSEDRGRAFFHGHSFTGHPIGCAVARASLALALENDVPSRLDAIGARIESRVRAGLEGSPQARDLRRTGGIVAFDLVDPAGGHAGYLAARTPALRRRAADRGVLLRPLGNVVYAMPPACLGPEQADQIADAMLDLADPR